MQFQRIWAAGILTSMMRWLDLLVLGVFTFELTDSAGQVALVLVARMLPRLFFGVALGTLECVRCWMRGRPWTG